MTLPLNICQMSRYWRTNKPDGQTRACGVLINHPDVLGLLWSFPICLHYIPLCVTDDCLMDTMWNVWGDCAGRLSNSCVARRQSCALFVAVDIVHSFRVYDSMSLLSSSFISATSLRFIPWCPIFIFLLLPLLLSLISLSGVSWSPLSCVISRTQTEYALAAVKRIPVVPRQTGWSVGGEGRTAAGRCWSSPYAGASEKTWWLLAFMCCLSALWSRMCFCLSFLFFHTEKPLTDLPAWFLWKLPRLQEAYL